MQAATAKYEASELLKEIEQVEEGRKWLVSSLKKIAEESTAAALAARLDISAQYLSDVLNGRRSVSDDFLRRVATRL
jgi:hypothetical protein